MPQSLAQIYLHVVFSTKNRTPYLRDADFRRQLHAYLAGICKNLDCPSLVIGGVEDHVHVLSRFGRGITVSDFVRELKRPSSGWVKAENQDLSDFAWQDGYGAFSVSPSHVEKVRGYIARQEDHHRTESFQDEMRRLLRIYGVEFDERYIWG